ncbi:MAG TPA: class I SAM-dependent methyltransferase [Acidiferrobacteraceae bacterium]|nr:class I SAM-dependent methyltransferase [Acidiferrobacteraceae bacterium]
MSGQTMGNDGANMNMGSSEENFPVRKGGWYQRFEDGAEEGAGARDRSELAAQVFANLRVGESVLDVGCAEGYFCFDAMRRGAGHVVGLDKKSSRIEAAVYMQKFKTQDVDFINQNFMEIDPANLGSFDYVICLNVIHHIGDTVAMVGKLMSVAKRYLVLEIPDLTELAARTTLGRWGRIFSLLPIRYQPPVMVLGQNKSIYIAPKAMESMLKLRHGPRIKNIKITPTYHSRKMSRYLLVASLKEK